MPRPANKSDLLAESRQEYDALEKLVAPLTPEQMAKPGALGEWSVKDVLAHLYEWQRMFFDAYEIAVRGDTPVLPAPGYNWDQLAELNQKIYETYRDHPLDEVLSAFRDSHQKMVALIESLSEEVLFVPERSFWPGGHPLGRYISANTGNHYNWARTEMSEKLNQRSVEAG